MTAHESFAHSPEYVQGTNTNFGYTFAGIFAFFALWPLVWSGAPLKPWLLALAAVFLLVTLWAPHWFTPLNKLWFSFSVVLGKVFVPLTMVPIFAVAVVPIGLLMKGLGKDPLRLTLQPAAKSYWLEVLPDPEATMKDQF